VVAYLYLILIENNGDNIKKMFQVPIPGKG